MNNIYDVLEICLQELENGADLETVLARYPDLANELRPILNASVMARTMAVPAPSPDAIRRGRAKLLQHASEMREAKLAPRKRMIPIFQRFAISLTLATIIPRQRNGTGGRVLLCIARGKSISSQTHMGRCALILCTQT